MLVSARRLCSIHTNTEDCFDIVLNTLCKRFAAFKKLQEVLQKAAQDQDAATDSESAPGVFTDVLTVQGSDVAKVTLPDIEPEVFEDCLRFTHK